MHKWEWEKLFYFNKKEINAETASTQKRKKKIMNYLEAFKWFEWIQKFEMFQTYRSLLFVTASFNLMQNY